MKLRTQKSKLTGRVAIPGSKSHTIRCVAVASLAEGVSEIEAALDSADTQAAVRVYQGLGAQIEQCEGVWRITGTGGQLAAPANVLDVGNSGTTLRFAIGSAALLASGAAVLTGDGQIRNRPQGPLLAALNDLGADCFSTCDNGKAPVVVRGPLRGGQTTIEAVTSQFLSALLVNAPLASGDSLINVSKLHEAPYVEITLGYLAEAGIRYEAEGLRRFAIPGGQRYPALHKRVPADFSSATFFLCAAAIAGGTVVLEGLDFSDAQGDKAVVDMLKSMGARIEVGPEEVLVRGGPLQAATLDLNATPDALPALAVTACFSEGTTQLVNVPQARLKETDRIAVMTQELRRLGAQIEELPDGMVITGGPLRGGAVHGHEDHRVVMALALAGLALAEPVEVDTAEAMAVTFPDYAKLMQAIGADVAVI